MNSQKIALAQFLYVLQYLKAKKTMSFIPLLVLASSGLSYDHFCSVS